MIACFSMGEKLTYIVTDVRDRVLLKKLFIKMSSVFSIKLKEYKNKCNLLLGNDQEKTCFHYSLSKFEIISLELLTEIAIFFYTEIC